MFNTTDNQFRFSRRETLRTVGATAALMLGTTAAGQPHQAHAATATSTRPPAMQLASGRTALGWR